MNRLTDNENAARWRETQKRTALTVARAQFTDLMLLSLAGMLWTGPRAGQALAMWIDGHSRAGGSATMWLVAFLLMSAALFWGAVMFPAPEDFDLTDDKICKPTH